MTWCVGDVCGCGGVGLLNPALCGYGGVGLLNPAFLLCEGLGC